MSAAQPEGPGFLFIVGHMRGYTTLLSHILGSHPRISGYYEQQVSYDTPAALGQLRDNLRRDALPGKEAGGYLLDKLLHNNLGLADAVLANPSVRILVTLREPEPTLHSILRIYPEWTEREAVLYYATRLAWMHALVSNPALDPARALYVDGEALVGDTAGTLRTLEGFLGLATPLSEHYELFGNSGQRGYGDASAHLRARRVVRDRPGQRQAVSDRAVEVSADVYGKCRELFLARLAK